MQYPLSLQKLDQQQFTGADGYVVFCPENIPAGTRARPKFTMDVAQWEDEGRPTDITVEVRLRSVAGTQAAKDKTQELAETLNKK